MSARLAFVCLFLLLGYPVLALAQDKPARGKVNIEDLKVRSGEGDKAATRQLAEMYYLGRSGVKQDFSEAARWYEKLARQGDARAQTSLGLMYARGYGVEKNLRTAHRWWSFAAAQNDPGAQYNLGLSYAQGEGVAQDYERAGEWYSRAARRGHINAQHNLGLLYHEGKGVERDPRRAYFWLKVAALQGDELSLEALKTVDKDMSADQIRESDVQAEEWMQKYKKVLK
ncbi:MAG: sel1 repeat family protein [Betaproteobacteria bacterium]|nr:sel1 repeat family protein [Betaproteobacteria bacterium]